MEQDTKQCRQPDTGLMQDLRAFGDELVRLKGRMCSLLSERPRPSLELQYGSTESVEDLEQYCEEVRQWMEQRRAELQ